MDEFLGLKNMFSRFFSKIINVIPWLLYMPWTIYFNFSQLPFRKACFLPIWLYKPHLGTLCGKVEIDNKFLKPGMIRLGKKEVFIYPGRGISIENRGIIHFKGKAFVGSDSYISVGKSGHLTIGYNFRASAAVTIISHYNLEIKDNVLIGWESKLMDTDFHQIKVEAGNEIPCACGKVVIGNGVWIANSVAVMQGTTIPDHCIVASHALVRKEMQCQERTMLAGMPAKPVKYGVWLDIDDCAVEYK